MAQEIDMTRIPEHIAIIMDGNGRWAMDRGLDRTFGHKAGLDNLDTITTICSNLGVKYLTVYAFSIENFNRPAYEVEALMGLILSFIKMDLFHNNNVSFHVVGDRERLPKSVQDKLRSMEEETAMYDGMALTIAMGYSSKQEIVNATKKIALEVQSGKMSADDINEETISKHLWTAWMPDPDLLIRTGGEVVSQTIYSGSVPIQSSISVTLTGRTLARRIFIRLLPAIKGVNAVLAKQRNKLKTKKKYERYQKDSHSTDGHAWYRHADESTGCH